MQTSLRTDLEMLERSAFAHVAGCREFLERYHHLEPSARKHADYGSLEKLYGWVLVPLSLWPVDVRGLGLHVLQTLETGQRLDAPTRLMCELLPETPSMDVCQL